MTAFKFLLSYWPVTLEKGIFNLGERLMFDIETFENVAITRRYGQVEKKYYTIVNIDVIVFVFWPFLTATNARHADIPAHPKLSD